MSKRLYRVDVWAAVENAENFDLGELDEVVDYDSETKIASVSDYADSIDECDEKADDFAEYLERHGVTVLEHNYEVVDVEKII